MSKVCALIHLPLVYMVALCAQLGCLGVTASLGCPTGHQASFDLLASLGFHPELEGDLCRCWGLWHQIWALDYRAASGRLSKGGRGVP